LLALRPVAATVGQTDDRMKRRDKLGLFAFGSGPGWFAAAAESTPRRSRLRPEADLFSPPATIRPAATTII
jgi:hypothetical protein